MDRTSSQTIKVAVIGCGAVAQNFYLQSLIKLESNSLISVRALLDTNPTNCLQLAQHFRHATIVSDLSKLTSSDIDLAIVASPNNLHGKQSIDLLSAGINVLCEKPMALTTQEAQAMLDQAKTSSRVLAIGLYRRFLPATAAVKSILSHGTLGSINSFHITEGGAFNWPLQSGSLFDKQKAGGGVLLDIGSHVLDLVCWWFGDPIELSYQDDAMGGLEASCSLTMKFKQGFSGKVQLSRDWSVCNSYQIECEKGWLGWVPGDCNQVQMGFKEPGITLDAQVHDFQDTQLHSLPDFEQCFTRQLLNVVQAVNGLEPVLISGQDGLKSLKVIESCYAQRQFLPLPWLNSQELKAATKLNQPC